jgi:hypothetical protein
MDSPCFYTVFAVKTPTPEFRPPTTEEMRALGRAYASDPNVRRLLLEIGHLRDVLREIETTRQSIERAWKEEFDGQLVGLEVLRCRLQEERVRIGLYGRDC